uniref:Uncharacterized protein n=1 Tax=Anopheles farauti TaxID=69004 RepID=A0A182Q8R0_9DIPT
MVGSRPGATLYMSEPVGCTARNRGKRTERSSEFPSGHWESMEPVAAAAAAAAAAAPPPYAAVPPPYSEPGFEGPPLVGPADAPGPAVGPDCGLVYMSAVEPAAEPAVFGGMFHEFQLPDP